MACHKLMYKYLKSLDNVRSLARKYANATNESQKIIKATDRYDFIPATQKTSFEVIELV